MQVYDLLRVLIVMTQRMEMTDGSIIIMILEFVLASDRNSCQKTCFAKYKPYNCI